MKATIEKQNAQFIDFHSEHYQTGLLNLCLPLINSVIEELNNRQKTRFTELFVNSHQVVIYNLLGNLLSLSLKTLVSNYKILKHQGIFPEATELERLKSFSDHLKEPEIRSYLLDKYPILKKWLINEAKVWLEQTHSLAVRLEEDYDTIKKEFFNNEDLGKILKVTFGLGDRHRGGKTVALIEFESEKKLIYKPRNLGIDLHFAEFLAQLDTQLEIGFLTPKIINKETYGWVEFIQNTSCTKKEEIHNYYFRKGAYLAILYTMEATDFHYENIIAHGEYPVLIDLESFFHPYFPMLGSETNEAVTKSVLRTGILPSTISTDTDSVDVSGLTDVADQKGLVNTMILRMNGDDIEYIRDKGVLVGGKNIPLLNDEKVAISAEHIPDFKKGFETVYQYLNTNKEVIKSQLTPFFNDEVRVLMRNTIVYVHLLEESTHPTIMESEAAVKAHFAWLRERIKIYKLAEVFCPFEEAILLKREVPLFTTKVNSKHLWYEDDQYIENFFEDTGKNTVFKRIDTLSEADLKRQLWIIDASFTISKAKDKENISYKRLDPNANVPLPSKTKLLEESIKVADYVIDAINIDEDTCNWLIFTASDLESKNFQIAESFYDLFTGMPGEILYFSYLHKVTGIEKYKTLALKAIHYLDQKIEAAKNSINVLGFYAGWGSLIDLNTKLGTLWDKELYFSKIERFFDTIDFETILQKDKDYSLLKGASGFIVACTNYYKLSNSERALALAKKAANHLLKNAITKDNYIAWKIMSKVPLSGLAHGSSGFALAFSKLYEITKNEKHLVAITKILNYEDSLFVEEQGNWKDCRDIVTNNFPGKVLCATTWAHGAPGIGISRLSLLKAKIPIENLEKDITIALQTTLDKGFGKKQSLSSGDFGNLEFLLQYVQHYNDKDVQKQLYTLLQLLIDAIEEHGWQIGSKNMYSLGMMTGITGIGYQFLRMAYPEIVPSLLNGE